MSSLPTSKWSHIDPFEGYESHKNVPWLKDRTIFVTLHGSQAYGTSTADSDIDLKGLCIPPREYFLGYMHKFEQAESSQPYDMVVYGLRKFMQLAADCNPNIIEVLFTSPEHWVLSTGFHEKLYMNRHKFLSRKARHTFSGYAHSQLKRIQTHRRWLLNPPTHKPTRSEYGLPEQQKMSQSELGAAEKLLEQEVPLDGKVVDLFNREKQYQAALREWEQYQRWKRERNQERAALEAKFGFDTKHAMHLIRLMRMCREILRDHEVLVHRPDAEELMAIRRGEWSYDDVMEAAENLEEEVKQLEETSTLPKKPNRNQLDDLCVDLVEDALHEDVLREE